MDITQVDRRDLHVSDRRADKTNGVKMPTADVLSLLAWAHQLSELMPSSAAEHGVLFRIAEDLCKLADKANR